MAIFAKKVDVPHTKEAFKVLRNAAPTTMWEPTSPAAELQDKVSNREESIGQRARCTPQWHGPVQEGPMQAEQQIRELVVRQPDQD